MQKPLIENTQAKKIVCDIHVRKMFRAYFKDSTNGTPEYILENAARDMLGRKLEKLDFVQEQMLVKKTADRIEIAIGRVKADRHFEKANDARDFAIGARIHKWGMTAITGMFAIIGSIEGVIIGAAIVGFEYALEKFQLKRLEKEIVKTTDRLFETLCQK